MKRLRTTSYRKYSEQKFNAAKRGIPFLLTFVDWWEIWDTSGHWNERGCNKNCYVMARYFDKGAYEVGGKHKGRLFG